MGLRRGDIIIVAGPGEFGKPRPVVIVQADMSMVEDAITYVPITSDLLRQPLSRVPIQPTAENGLRNHSEIMVDRIQTCSLSRIGGHIGHVDASTMRQVDTVLMLHLGLI